MDFFQHRYYRLNKTMMTLVGYWPYQSTCIRATLSVILLLSLATQIVPQTLALVKYRHDPKIVFECVITFLFEAICAMKGIFLVWNVDKALKLLNRIRTDWQVWAWDRDVNIIHEYAEHGRKLTFMYTGGINAAIVVYATQPILPTIIDVLLKNGTAPRKFPTPVDFYYFDAQEYYWYIVMHNYISLSTGMIIIVAGEVMLITYVQHVCSIFTALGRKFQRVGKNGISVKSGGTPYGRDLVDIPLCIDRHNDAIKFANLIDATYTWNIFWVSVLGMILLNLSGLQIILAKNEPDATIRYIGITMGIVVHSYLQCNFSQKLMDCSTSIHSYIHKSEWYNLAPDAQKPLQVMMMLCCVPCQITAGKYVTLGTRSFGQAVRTAMSYFAFVRSIPG